MKKPGHVLWLNLETLGFQLITQGKKPILWLPLPMIKQL